MGENSGAATPIIVVGINRSGTKWLTNEIGEHPDVTSIRADVHYGIVESNLLTEFGRSFDLTTDRGYEALLEFWSSTHFFELAAGDVDWFRSLSVRPSNSVEALRLLLDRRAQAEGRRFWVQKVAPVDAAATLEALPDARAVAIRRQPADAVRSRIKQDALRAMSTSPWRAGLSHGIQTRQLDRVVDRFQPLEVSYEDLVVDKHAVLARVREYVGLERFEASSPFEPNTSFEAPAERKEVLGRSGQLVVALTGALCRAMPYPILESAQRILTRGRPNVIPGSFAHRESDTQGTSPQSA